MADDTTIPTWGYRPDGDARIFPLAPGEALPDGWGASPDVITDPALASADALTARAEGRAFVPVPVISADELPAAMRAEPNAAEAERLQRIIDAGMAENQSLYERLDAAEAEVAQAVRVAEGFRADLDATALDIAALRETLAKAQADGGSAAAERDEAHARIEVLTADLAKARADLDEMLTEPGEPAKAGK